MRPKSRYIALLWSLLLRYHFPEPTERLSWIKDIPRNMCKLTFSRTCSLIPPLFRESLTKSDLVRLVQRQPELTWSEKICKATDPRKLEKKHLCKILTGKSGYCHPPSPSIQDPGSPAGPTLEGAALDTSSASATAGVDTSMLADKPPAAVYHRKVCFSERLKNWSVLITISGNRPSLPGV